MQETFSRAADSVEDWLRQGIDHCMNNYNK